MRLIDADSLKYRRMEYGAHDDVPMGERKKGIQYLLKEDIDDAPTIEPKRGKWIFYRTFNDWDIPIWQECGCTECKTIIQMPPRFRYPYCPNCGAKMERSEVKYVVYRRVLQGADGNQGVEYELAAQFETADEANAFIAQQTDKNGWVDYVAERREE